MFYVQIRISFWSRSENDADINKSPNMRYLYISLMFAVLTSATNGYDGSMMNGLQALPQWKTCELSFIARYPPVTDIRSVQPSWTINSRSLECHHVCWFNCCLANNPIHCGYTWSTGRCHHRMYHHDHWSRSSVNRSQHFHVHCCSFLDWVWCCHRSGCSTIVDHGIGSPSTSGYLHNHLQLDLVLW